MMFGVDTDDVKAITDAIEGCGSLVEAVFKQLPQKLPVLDVLDGSPVAVTVEARLVGACVIVAGAVIAGAIATAGSELRDTLAYLDDTLERVNMREPG